MCLYVFCYCLDVAFLNFCNVELVYRELNCHVEYTLLLQHILALAGTGGLKIAPYSADLFPEAEADPKFLENAGETDICFVEDRSLRPFENRVGQIWLYHWNRRYPADLFFDLPLENYQLVYSDSFAGYSHEKITAEHWIC